ncbi:uncharacterized protein UTRI_00005 [Ustilago trichophora]|uniref:Uncharacterized protein n=1 Tax=Ustilago trichophora TaxID=86804 RepID=A0A5C3DU55_9BASI|nr:uncharacterized protein UTRI_00005 [Ustilago trichophora]
MSPSSPLSSSSASQSTSTGDSDVISLEARNKLYSKLLSDLLLELVKDPNQYPKALRDICKLVNPKPEWQLRAALAVLCDHRQSFFPLVHRKLGDNALHLPRDVKNELMHRIGKRQYQCNQPQHIDIVYTRLVAWIKTQTSQNSDSDTSAQPLSTQDCLDVVLRLILRPSPKSPPPLETRATRQQLVQAFATDFRGPALHNLLRHLKVLSRHSFNPIPPSKSAAGIPSRPYYAKVVSILQSSGFGKTKLCVHLSAQQAGLLVCLRADDKAASSVTSFPPQDEKIYGLLSACSTAFADVINNVDRKNNDELAATADLCACVTLGCFLAAYCHVLTDKLTKLMRLSGCFEWHHHEQHPQSKHATPGMCWNSIVFALSASLHRKSTFVGQLKLKADGMCRTSALFSHDLIRIDADESPHSTTPAPDLSLYDQLPKDLKLFVDELRSPDTRDNLLKAVKEEADRLLPEAQQLKSAKDLAQGLVKPRLSQLERLAPSQPDDNSTIFFLALDECSSISPILPHLRRLWSFSQPQRTWIFLIDTKSHIPPLAGSEALSSSRLQFGTGTHQIAPPFTTMPLDVHHSPEEAAKLQSDFANRSCTARRLNLLIPKLGRPLWNDKQFYRDEHGIPKCHHIISKLVKSNFVWQWPSDLDKIVDLFDWDDDKAAGDRDFQNIMALTSQRVPLGLSCNAVKRKWQRFAKDQISNHLRVVSKVHPQTDVVESHTNSEPPLGIAAAWSFRYQADRIKSKWSLAVATVIRAQNAIGLNVGLEGEEGIHLLCTMATDFAAEDKYQNDYESVGLDDEAEDHAAKYKCTMGLVTVKDWLDVLIGSKLTSADESNAEADRAFDAWCSQNWINFKQIGDHDLGRQVKMKRKADAKETDGKNHVDGGDEDHNAYDKKASGGREHDKDAATSLDRGLLANFWVRHAAIRGVSNQKGWDLLIPVYESTEMPIGDEPFALERLSYIAIQVKNTVNAPDFPEQLGPDLDDIVDSIRTTSCLELFLDLRGPITKAHSLLSSAEPANTDANIARRVRYNIYVSGLDEQSYPVLKRLDELAKNMTPTLFGLSSYGTNQFDHDFAHYVCDLENNDDKVADRQQLDAAEGKCPLIQGIPMRNPPALLQRPTNRIFGTGQSKRMRATGQDDAGLSGELQIKRLKSSPA